MSSNRHGKAIRSASGGLRGDRTPEFYRVGQEPDGLDALALNLAKIVEQLIGLAARHSLITFGLAAFGVSLVKLGPAITGAWVGFLIVAMLVWRRRWPDSFARLVTRPVRSWWRATVRYRRHWQPAMVTTGLTDEYGGDEYVPAICTVVAGPFVDNVLVQLLAGQSPADFENNTDALAHTFTALRCQVRVDRPGWIWLDFHHRDALAEPLDALPVPSIPDYLGLPLGQREDGTPWLLRLLGGHVLVAGATGAGKGSVLWGIVRALSNAIRRREALLWGIDPKGGMELVFGRPLFDRLAYESSPGMLTLLDDAVRFMKDRQRRLLGSTRLHAVSTGEPLLVLVVDELAALIAYTDRETKRKASDLLQLLLSQGRAVGIVVVAAVQDPSKDIVPFRDLFPTRIGLRLVEDAQVDMVLGQGARKRGAECDRIPASLPGVGYVVLEGIREPVRVRAAYVSDDDLADMGRTYQPAVPVVDLSKSKRSERPSHGGEAA